MQFMFLSRCHSLSSISFEPGSNLQRIEGSAFFNSGQKTIIIFSSVTYLCRWCFSEWRSLLAISFESASNLQRINECAFSSSGLTTIMIPSSVAHLCKSCSFSIGVHFDQCHLNQGWICTELKNLHFIGVVCKPLLVL
jgi:hypothetical protein